MTAAPRSLTAFILARIAEDESTASAPFTRGPVASRLAEDGDRVTMHPDRVLAECAAKRAIVQSVTVPLASLSFAGATPVPGDDPSNLLGHLAAVHADHPDYDPAWRP